METYVLSPEECKVLEDDGIFLTCHQHGKWKISASFLSGSWTTSPPSANEGVSSRGSSVSVSRYRTEIQEDIVFPERLESAATLECIGLNPIIAEEIYTRWESRPDPRQNPNDLLDYVYGHTARMRRDSWRQYSDQQVLARLGVAEWLQDAILDPRYTDLYQTNTLKFWLKETFRVNYNSIVRVIDKLKSYVAVRGLDSAADSAKQVAAMSTTSNSAHLPPHVSIEEADPILDHHEVYFKAKAADDIYWGEPLIASDGSVHMFAIQSRAGEDSNPQNPAWHWTPDREIAEKCRGFSELRQPYSEQWIIRIQVPKSFTRELKKEELWCSPNLGECPWCLERKRPFLGILVKRPATPV